MSFTFDDPDVAHDVAVISAWAAKNDLVHRVWIFGSRVRGNHQSNSDLDVAVQHGIKSGDTDAITTEIFERQNWIDELQPITRLQLDVWSYHPGETPTIEAGIRAGSVLIYEQIK